MLNINKIHDGVSALEFKEFSNDPIKYLELAYFIKAKNKFNHVLTVKDKSFKIFNKELFIEQLLNILDSPEKFKLYKIFLDNHCHFITTRPAFLKKYTKDFYFTQYVILNGTTHIDTNNYDNFVKSNWADCLLHDLHESAEYNSYIYQETLRNLHIVIELYHHILNFKNLFEVNYFTKQFWMLYQHLIFHPHADSENKILTFTDTYLYRCTNMFQYINENLNELPINNIYELFNESFVKFILTNVVNDKYIPINNYDFKMFCKYCRKELNK